MITPIVVVVHELRDRDFQIPWNIVWDLVDVKFDGPVIPLQFAVGLRMEGRESSASYPNFLSLANSDQLSAVSVQPDCFILRKAKLP